MLRGTHVAWHVAGVQIVLVIISRLDRQKNMSLGCGGALVGLKRPQRRSPASVQRLTTTTADFDLSMFDTIHKRLNAPCTIKVIVVHH